MTQLSDSEDIKQWAETLRDQVSRISGRKSAGAKSGFNTELKADLLDAIDILLEQVEEPDSSPDPVQIAVSEIGDRVAQLVDETKTSIQGQGQSLEETLGTLLQELSDSVANTAEVQKEALSQQDAAVTKQTEAAQRYEELLQLQQDASDSLAKTAEKYDELISQQSPEALEDRLEQLLGSASDQFAEVTSKFESLVEQSFPSGDEQERIAELCESAAKGQIEFTESVEHLISEGLSPLQDLSAASQQLEKYVERCQQAADKAKEYSQHQSEAAETYFQSIGQRIEDLSNNLSGAGNSSSDTDLLERQFADLESRIEAKFEARFKAADKSAASRQEKSEDLIEDLKRATDELAMNESAKVKSLREQISDLKESLEVEKSEKEASLEKQESAQAKLDELVAKIEEEKASIESLNSELKKAREEVEVAEQTVRDAEARARAAEEEAEAAKSANHEVDTLKSEFEELDKAFEKLQDEKQSLEREYEKSESHVAELEREHSKKVSNLEETVERLYEELDESNTKLEAAQSAEPQSRGDDASRKEFEEVTSLLKQARHEIEVLQEQNADLATQVAKLEVQSQCESEVEAESSSKTQEANSELLDSDEVIQAEREKLKNTQQEWEEKLRQAEIDLSLERAELARQRIELEKELSDMRKQQDTGSGTGRTRKWLDHLGLRDETKDKD